MADDKSNDADRRRWALLVSSLVTAGDSDLEAFRRRRGVEPSLDLDRLRLAREVLEWIGGALGTSEDARWSVLDRAAVALGLEVRRTSEPRFDAESEAAPSAPATPVAADANEAADPPRPALIGALSPGLDAPIAPVATTSPWLKATPVVAHGSPAAARLEGPAAPKPHAVRPPPPPLPPEPTPRPVVGAAATPRLAAERPSTTPEPPPLVAPKGLRATTPEARPVAPRPAVAEARAAVNVANATAGDALAALLAKNPRLAAFAEATESSGGQTVVVTGARPSEPALPFQAPTSEEPPASRRPGTLPPPSETSNHVTARDEAPEPRRSTAEALPWGRSRAPSEMTLAFEPLGPNGAPRAKPAEPQRLPEHLATMPLERYAALEVQRRLWPDWRASIEQAFGITSEGERSALDTHWQHALASDPELTRAFEWHRDQHERWERERSR